MNQEQILSLVTAITTILLIISELLGLSKCESNSILQFLKNIKLTSQCISEERPVTPPLPQERTYETLPRK